MSEQKTKPTNASVKAFLEAIEPDGRRRDAIALEELMAKVTGLEPAMWGPSMVGYGEYDYIYESGHSDTSFVTGFSPRKANLVVYLMPGFDGATHLLGKLGKYKTGKSCLYINKLADIDMGALEELIRAAFTAMLRKYPAAP
jgi:hypothetical protein